MRSGSWQKTDARICYVFSLVNDRHTWRIRERQLIIFKLYFQIGKTQMNIYIYILLLTKLCNNNIYDATSAIQHDMLRAMLRKINYVSI